MRSLINHNKTTSKFDLSVNGAYVDTFETMREAEAAEEEIVRNRRKLSEQGTLKLE